VTATVTAGGDRPSARGDGPLVIGIDLGTTNSLVAVLQAGKPVAIPNAVGEHLTPSAVSVLENGELLVGAAALARQVTHPADTATAFKRDMGTDRRHVLRGKSFMPQELSALVLRSLRQDVEAAFGRPVDEAVITVPAYFDELQRRATRDAATIAGLKAERIINEPTAAALAYGLHQRAREFRAVVLDLGGGTFDVTVLEVMEGVIEIQSTAGDSRLGGEDFVDAMAELVAAESGRADLRGEARAWAALRAACERAKRRLSAAPQAEVVLAEVPLDRERALSLRHALARENVERAWAPLLRRMEAPIARALRDAGAAPERVDEVLLVGGATRTPCVIRLAAELFGRMPLRNLPPDEAVAYGAAVQAALKVRDESVQDLVVTDVAPFSMGVATASAMGRQTIAGLFSPVLERGTVIPASRIQRFQTVHPDQRLIKIEVFQGEHSLCRENKKLGEFTVGPLPARPAGHVPIDVRFTYDLNGLLEVEATVPDTGQTASVVLEQIPGRLSADEIAQARRAMDRLKFHPRDTLPNATALARAEALFIELTGPAREALAQQMSAMRLALETQDPALIADAREQLTVLLARLSSS
jgi:molecular chaperone HscC